EARSVPAPWCTDAAFVGARLGFRQLSRDPLADDAGRAELFGHAERLGRLLFGVLFDEAGREQLRKVAVPGQRPLVELRSGDDGVLALPWELLHDGTRFLVRDGDIDLARSTPDGAAGGALLH